MIKLGAWATDKITGFSGIVTGRCDYLYGCRSYEVLPKKLDEEGQPVKPVWFDEKRLDSESDEPGGVARGPTQQHSHPE